MEKTEATLQKIHNLLTLGATEGEEGRTSAHLAAKMIVELSVGLYFKRPGNRGSSVTPTGTSEDTSRQFADVDREFVQRVAPLIENAALISLNKGSRASVNAMILGYEKAMKVEIPFATRKALASKLIRMFTVRRKAGLVFSVRGRGGGYQMVEGMKYAPTTPNTPPTVKDPEPEPVSQ